MDNKSLIEYKQSIFSKVKNVINRFLNLFKKNKDKIQEEILPIENNQLEEFNAIDYIDEGELLYRKEYETDIVSSKENKERIFNIYNQIKNGTLNFEELNNDDLFIIHQLLLKELDIASKK